MRIKRDNGVKGRAKTGVDQESNTAERQHESTLTDAWTLALRLMNFKTLSIRHSQFGRQGGLTAASNHDRDFTWNYFKTHLPRPDPQLFPAQAKLNSAAFSWVELDFGETF